MTREIVSVCATCDHKLGRPRTGLVACEAEGHVLAERIITTGKNPYGYEQTPQMACPWHRPALCVG